MRRVPAGQAASRQQYLMRIIPPFGGRFQHPLVILQNEIENRRQKLGIVKPLAQGSGGVAGGAEEMAQPFGIPGEPGGDLKGECGGSIG